MLEIVEYGKDEYGFPALVVLGCFDAIHAGHRELLKKAKLQAKINGLDLGVMMFREGKSGKLVYSFEERCALLEQYNVKFVLAVDFNEEFMSVAPMDFLSAVEDKINVKAYMSGKDFRFGAKAKGKSSTLKNYAEDEENGVWYMSVKDVDMDGEKISTTLIKSCLDAGDVAKANRLLGAEFSVSGEVVRGEGRGTSVVGFPTVNIVYPEWKHPLKHGVYSVKCLIGETDYQGIANFGTCPTFGDDRVALEVYFEGFSGDLYGQVLTIRFIDYIRDIEEFGSAEELSGQLRNDLLSVADELAVSGDEQPEETVAAEVVEEQPEEQPEEPVVEEVVEEQPEEPVVEEVVEEQPEEPVVEEVVEEQPEEFPVEDVAVEELADDGFDEAVTEEEAEEVVTEEEQSNDEQSNDEQSVAGEETQEVLPEQIMVELPDEMQYSEGESGAIAEEPVAPEEEVSQSDDGDQLNFIDEAMAESGETSVEETEVAATESEDATDGETGNEDSDDGGEN